MKKKAINRVVFTLIMVATLCSMSGNVFAAGLDDFAASKGVISPRYATIRSLSAHLTISRSGQASCQVKASFYGSYTGEITMYLQDQSGGWQTIKSWSDAGSGCSGSYYVPSGDTYRVKGDLCVYDHSGKLVETATTYSDLISY